MINRKPLAQLESILQKGGLIVLNGNRDDHKAFFKGAIAHTLLTTHPQGPKFAADLTALKSLESPGLFDAFGAGAGSKSYVELQGLKDKDLTPLLEHMATLDAGSVVIAETSWTTKSKSYLALEPHKLAIIFPCYGLELNDYLTYVKALLQKRSIPVTPQGAVALASLLQDQPSLIFQEVEKLSLYCSENAQPIGEQEIQELCASKDTLKLEEILMAFLNRDRETVLRLARGEVLEESAVMLCRLLGRQMMQLLELQSLQKQGVEISQAWFRVFHPVFYKMQPIFTRALSRWSSQQASVVLHELTHLEKSIKGDALTSTQIQMRLDGCLI